MTPGGLTTFAEAMAYAEHEIDMLIERHLKLLEKKIRLDIAATGPEDEDALDRIPDPASPWQRSTPEEAVLLERARMLEWKARTLEDLRVIFAKTYSAEP